jgi:excinuclease ABC subunit C
LLLLQYAVEDIDVVKQWFRGRRKGKVDIQIPRAGSKKHLMNIVAENARQCLEQLKIKRLAAPRVLEEALAEIQRELHLPRLPSRIEGYDTSNIQGTSAVGSMVVFDEGRPKPAHYRRFAIKTVSGADDYAMLREVLRRRFKYLERTDTSTPSTWAVLPDLVLIDGGRGQLNAAITVMNETGAISVPVASLAKENEEIFTALEARPIVLARSSPGLQLLQRLRDEAHRFALGYHQKVHKKRAFASALDGIPGIGPKHKRALVRHFGSIQAIRAATTEELATVKGMNQSLAKKIKEHL